MWLGLIFERRFRIIVIIIIVVICAITQHAAVNFAGTLCNYSVTRIVYYYSIDPIGGVVVTAGRLHCALYLLV